MEIDLVDLCKKIVRDFKNKQIMLSPGDSLSLEGRDGGEVLIQVLGIFPPKSSLPKTIWGRIALWFCKHNHHLSVKKEWLRFKGYYDDSVYKHTCRICGKEWEGVS